MLWWGYDVYMEAMEGGELYGRLGAGGFPY